MTDKYICGDCGEKIKRDQLLRADHPFRKTDVIYGCPRCKGVQELYRACDDNDCWLKTTGNINTAQGYLCVCSKHFELIIAQKEADEEDIIVNKVLKTIEDNKP